MKESSCIYDICLERSGTYLVTISFAMQKYFYRENTEIIHGHLALLSEYLGCKQQHLNCKTIQVLWKRQWRKKSRAYGYSIPSDLPLQSDKCSLLNLVICLSRDQQMVLIWNQMRNIAAPISLCDHITVQKTCIAACQNNLFHLFLQ